MRYLAIPTKLLVLAALCSTGCSAMIMESGGRFPYESPGPTGAPNWQETVASATLPQDGPVDFHSTAVWRPDTDGYKDNRLFDTRDVLQKYGKQGVFAMTQSSIVFLLWVSNKQRYEVTYRLPFTDILESRIDSRGVARQLVVTSKDDRSHSFWLCNPKCTRGDRDANERAGMLLLERIAKP